MLVFLVVCLNYGAALWLFCVDAKYSTCACLVFLSQLASLVLVFYFKARLLADLLEQFQNTQPTLRCNSTNQQLSRSRIRRLLETFRSE